MPTDAERIAQLEKRVGELLKENSRLAARKQELQAVVREMTDLAGDGFVAWSLVDKDWFLRVWEMGRKAMRDPAPEGVPF